MVLLNSVSTVLMACTQYFNTSEYYGMSDLTHLSNIGKQYRYSTVHALLICCFISGVDQV